MREAAAGGTVGLRSWWVRPDYQRAKGGRVSEKKPSEQEGKQRTWPSLHDSAATAIAFIVILLWAFWIGRGIWTGTLDQASLQNIFGPLLGVVFGYYFGERTARGAIEQADRRTQDALQEKERVKTVTAEEYGRLEQEYAVMKDRLRQLEARAEKEQEKP